MEEISKRLFPHEYFAQKSLYYPRPTRRGPPIPVPLLRVEHINVLARAKGLTERQQPHIDGPDLKIIVLVVDHCNPNGYNFAYMPASHNPLSKHKIEIIVPTGMMRSVHGKHLDFVVLAESVIHAGGTSSWSSKESAI